MNISPFFSYFKVAPLQDLEVRLEKEEKGKRYKRFFKTQKSNVIPTKAKEKDLYFGEAFFLVCTVDIRRNAISVFSETPNECQILHSSLIYPELEVLNNQEQQKSFLPSMRLIFFNVWM